MTIQGSGTWDSFTNWPYPKVVYTGEHFIGAAIHTTDLFLFELRVESNDWNAVFIKNLQEYSGDVTIDVAGFSTFYVICVETSASNWMYKKDVTVAVGTSSLVECTKTDYPVGSTVCNFKGQAVIGGIESSNDIWSGLGYCSVAWSEIGNFEFDPKGNPSAGFLVMPWDDHKGARVHKVKRLNNSVVVYGDTGRALLIPYGNKNVSGFGLKELTGSGIPYQSCVGGDDNAHCFIDQNHDLWLATEDMKFQKLGYREWMDDLFESGDDVVVSFSGKEKKFYISDGNYCFVLTERGMYSTNQCPTCVFDYGDVLSGLFSDNQDYETRLSLSQTDFGVRGLKTLETLDFSVDHDHSSELMYGRVDTRYGHDSSFRTGDWVRLNDVGMVTPVITGNDFIIRFKGPDYRTTSNLTLDDIRARYKVVDKRGLRGIYAG